MQSDDDAWSLFIRALSDGNCGDLGRFLRLHCQSMRGRAGGCCAADQSGPLVMTKAGSENQPLAGSWSGDDGETARDGEPTPGKLRVLATDRKPPRALTDRGPVLGHMPARAGRPNHKK